MVPDVVVDGGVEAVVDDGEAAGARSAEHQRTGDDAVPVGCPLEHVGGTLDGVALVVGDVAFLGVAADGGDVVRRDGALREAVGVAEDERVRASAEEVDDVVLIGRQAGPCAGGESSGGRRRRTG